MTKYWGIWDKSRQRWWKPIYDLNWIAVKGTKKIINDVPIWDHRGGLDSLFENSSTWEVKEFTPADALLVKCGKA